MSDTATRLGLLSDEALWHLVRVEIPTFLLDHPRERDAFLFEGSMLMSDPQHDTPLPSPDGASPDTDRVEPRASVAAGARIPPVTWDALAEAAARINIATEEIAVSIASINRGLAKLNIGVPVHCYIEPVNDDHDWIGYDRLDGRWGIVLGSGDKEWHFNSAPRKLRLQAINQIPKLLQSMTDAADDLSGLIDAKMRRIRSLRT